LAPTLWLVRHAPTRDNLDGRVMGQRDVAPTSYGLSVAAGLAGETTFAQAVSSDARRAQDTARAIAPAAPLRLDERLRERCFGEWEGRDKRELRAERPDAFTAGGAIRLDADPPGGEPLAALLERVHAALSDLREAEGPVLVIGHNGSLRAALALLGERGLGAATTMSLDYLSPIVADAASLRALT
jgi:2,3-bisphosphoglycerate-dependent phosphoglycerate mutase